MCRSIMKSQISGNGVSNAAPKCQSRRETFYWNTAWRPPLTRTVQMEMAEASMQAMQPRQSPNVQMLRGPVWPCVSRACVPWSVCPPCAPTKRNVAAADCAEGCHQGAVRPRLRDGARPTRWLAHPCFRSGGSASCRLCPKEPSQFRPDCGVVSTSELQAGEINAAAFSLRVYKAARVCTTQLRHSPHKESAFLATAGMRHTPAHSDKRAASPPYTLRSRS